MAHGEYTVDAYHWGTLFESSEATVEVTKATFICAVVNGGLHLVSLSISVFLAIVFRKISHLPPDMNPLEDNLTARPRKSRKRIDGDEKHMSQSTVHSTMEDPLIGSPRSVPFIHTRDQSLSGDSSRDSWDIMNGKREPLITVQPHRLSHLEPSSPEALFHQPASQAFDLASQKPAPEFRKVPAQLPEFVDPSSHTRHLTSQMADRSESVSPLSDNWVTYSAHSPSPVSDMQDEPAQNVNVTNLRQSSSVYSRRTNTTTTSNGSGIRDWFAYGQKSPVSIGSVIPEDTRGEYASLVMHEYYGEEEENHERDLGDRRFNIFPDPEEHDHDHDDQHSKDLPFNPLMLNPPTPQPALSEITEDTDPVRRHALSENPNLSYNEKAQVSIQESPDSSPNPGRYYGELEEHGEFAISRSREVSVQEYLKSGPSKLSKKRSKKMLAYHSLKKDDSDDESYPNGQALSSPAVADGDRKGRVVSNSGADTARLGFVGGVGASLSSYGSYIAGLGVGRRRDVSGKLAEEGRSGKSPEERTLSIPNQSSTPIRAAGWARFAGL